MAGFVLTHAGGIRHALIGREGVMQKEEKKKWMGLCEQAADEQDPKKLAVLILQINFILEAKELRLTGKVVTAQPAVEALQL